MALNASQQSDLEGRVGTLGRQLLVAMRAADKEISAGNPWLERLLDRVMEDDRFRVQALRFVDVLPALDDDSDLVRHMQEYFSDHDLPTTSLVAWGLKHSRSGVADKLLARGIRRVMEGLAHRFMGGATALEAMQTVSRLREQGFAASLDLLGEATVSESEADAYLQTYLRALVDLALEAQVWPANDLLDMTAGRSAPRLHFSVKASALYSQCSAQAPAASCEGIARRLRQIFRAAREHDVALCLDMEQFDLKSIIIEVFCTLLEEPEFRDWPDAGIALQAYLTSTEDDLNHLLRWAERRGTPISVRLVRGAYWDYETVIADQKGWPQPVWDAKWKTDACYERCIGILMSHRGIVVPAIATHNVRSIALALELASDHGWEAGSFELQMLYGMAPALEAVILSKGHRVRLYVPFGELIPGMGYLVRRLLENSSSQSFQRLGGHTGLSDAQLLASMSGGIEPESGSALVVAESAFTNEALRRFTDAAERDAFAAAIEQVRGQLGGNYALRIGGDVAERAVQIVSINPARPHEVVGRVASATTDDAERAVACAREAQSAWAALPVTERADCLRKAAGAMRERRDELAAWQIFEAGKSWHEADADVCEAIDFFNYYANEAEHLQGGSAHDAAGETNTWDYRPRGVVVVLPPWNFPLAIAAGMTAAALVTGNAVILKPSSQTPVIASLLAGLLHDAGVPDGVLNFLPGAGQDIGDYLVRHPQVHCIAFTGSREVGCGIIEQSAQLAPGQQHIKHVITEMGGKNAIIIDSDADMDDAVAGVLASAFGYQGQKCSAASRAIVVGDHYARFLQRLVEAARSLPTGMPDDPATVVGPVIDSAAWKRIQHTIRAAANNARLVLDSDVTFLQPGYFVGPTIFADVDPASDLAQEEVFGPVLSVMAAANLDDAIELANGTRYALTGGIYSRSPKNLEQAIANLAVGNLYLNRPITGALVGRQPFGGFRLSGAGTQAGGPDYLLQFVVPRTVTENTLRRGFAPGARLD